MKTNSVNVRILQQQFSTHLFAYYKDTYKGIYIHKYIGLLTHVPSDMNCLMAFAKFLFILVVSGAVSSTSAAARRVSGAGS